jgi:hypothetical protein
MMMVNCTAWWYACSLDCLVLFESFFAQRWLFLKIVQIWFADNLSQYQVLVKMMLLKLLIRMDSEHCNAGMHCLKLTYKRGHMERWLKNIGDTVFLLMKNTFFNSMINC